MCINSVQHVLIGLFQQHEVIRKTSSLIRRFSEFRVRFTRHTFCELRGILQTTLQVSFRWNSPIGCTQGCTLRITNTHGISFIQQKLIRCTRGFRDHPVENSMHHVKCILLLSEMNYSLLYCSIPFFYSTYCRHCCLQFYFFFYIRVFPDRVGKLLETKVST